MSKNGRIDDKWIFQSDSLKHSSFKHCAKDVK